MAHFHVYKDNPTNGGTNGTQVSEGTGLSPISVTLNATQNEESSPITLAIRCESGYTTTGSTVISLTGTTANKWALSTDSTTWQEYGASLTIASAIGATNKLFYIKAKATSDEINPANDTSVDLHIEATVAAV